MEQAIMATILVMNERFGDGEVINGVEILDKTKGTGVVKLSTGFTRPFKIVKTVDVEYMGRQWQIFDRIKLNKMLLGHLEYAATFCTDCAVAQEYVNDEGIMCGPFDVTSHIRDLFSSNLFTT